MGQIQRSTFSTALLPPEQRIPAWRESISALFDISISPLASEEGFNTSVNSHLINNQLILSACQTRAQRFERSPLKVARDGLDYYMIQTHLSGSQVIDTGHRQVECRTGDLMIIDLAEQHDATTTDFSQLTIVIPRHLLARHLLQPDSQEGRVLRGNTGLTMLAVNHLKTLYGMMSAFSDEEAVQVIEPTLLLLASALNGSTEQVENGGSSVAVSLLARAKVEIEQNLRRQLSAEKLCATLGLSRSTLYRLFEPLGGVRAYIQERRLRRSVDALLQDKSGTRRICDIAYAWGFASEAHYSRAFRQRFGMTPSDARLGLGQQQQRSLITAPQQVGDRDYEQWLAENLRL